MRRRPIDKFCIDDYLCDHSNFREQKAKNRRAECLQIARFHQDQNFQQYLNDRSCPSPCSISSDSPSSQSDNLEFPPEQLTREDMFIIYESLVYQCPISGCSGTIFSENNNHFKCSNPCCTLEVRTQSRFMDRDDFINLLKPKFIEHLSKRCPETPEVLFIGQKLNIFCCICNYNQVV